MEWNILPLTSYYSTEKNSTQKSKKIWLLNGNNKNNNKPYLDAAVQDRKVFKEKFLVASLQTDSQGGGLTFSAKLRIPRAKQVGAPSL